MEKTVSVVTADKVAGSTTAVVGGTADIVLNSMRSAVLVSKAGLIAVG